MKDKFNSFDFLWLSLVLFFVLIIAFLLPVQPQDYWWYLRIGKDTLATSSLIRVDTLTYTRLGQPLIYQSWLSAILLWLEFLIGGLTLTVLIHGLVMGLTYTVIWILMRLAGGGTRLVSLITVLLVLASCNNWGIRPQAFTYPLFVISLLILWRWQQGHDNGLFALPPIGLLWVNLHGSFVLLFVLMGCSLVFGKGNRKLLGSILGISLLLTLFNPYGLGIWKFVWSMISNSSVLLFSSEWDPPVNQGWQMNLYFLWRLSFAPMAGFSKRRLTLLEWAWFLGFAWLASIGIRYVIWFLFILALCTVMLLVDWNQFVLDRIRPTSPYPINVLVGGVLVVSTFALLPGIRQEWWVKAPSSYGASTPVAATQWLAVHPDLPGELWSNFGFSSYLEYALPSRRVWIDTRFEIYPLEQWEGYFEVAEAWPEWQARLDQYHVNILMLSEGGEPKLIDYVRQSGNWCNQYEDSTAVIFTRLQAGQSCP